MVRTTSALGLVCAFAAGCSSAGAPATSSGSTTTSGVGAVPTGQKSGLDKLMRTRMNKSYTQLVFYVLDSDIDVEPAKLQHETEELRAAVEAVRALPMPPMVQSDEAREVYVTFNDTLQRDSDVFAAAVAASDRPKMEATLQKIGKTCNDCHRFFRVDVK
jgi:hypothetical protein